MHSVNNALFGRPRVPLKYFNPAGRVINEGDLVLDMLVKQLLAIRNVGTNKQMSEQSVILLRTQWLICWSTQCNVISKRV